MKLNDVECTSCHKNKPYELFEGIRHGLPHTFKYCPECRVRNNISAKKVYHKNPAKAKARLTKWMLIDENRKSMYLKKYWPGLNGKQAALKYNELLLSQSGVCAICQKPETSKDSYSGRTKDLAVDHDHRTGRVRGLLCYPCNIGLGSFKDSVELIQNAIEYVNGVIS